jgi:FkbM family methyltransferase
MGERVAGAGRHTVSALRRSFDVYYRDRDRTRRMDRLNAAFVRPGDLAFDIGAHVGDRTGSFLRLDARVVALEPQPLPGRALRLLYGRCARATLLPMAAGAAEGETELLLNRANPTVATLAPDFVAAASGARGWEGEVWDGRLRVPVTTLDALIARHGLPSFVKIDVEGHEAEVLAGLSTPLPCLSFEITTIQRAVAAACIARLGGLGRYVFNLSLGEDHLLRFDRWLPPEEIAREIEALPDAANSGDVFARLLPPQSRAGSAG